jgi:hypothetical protein
MPGTTDSNYYKGYLLAERGDYSSSLECLKKCLAGSRQNKKVAYY